MEERFKIKKIKLEDVYVSVLTGRLVQNEEGWSRMEPSSREVRPSGSLIIDTLVDVLLHTRYRRIKDIAAAMETEWLELSMGVHLLTGLTARDFVDQYRLMEAKEYLMYTSLSIPEVSSRCGFTSQSSFGKYFHTLMKMTPGAYRHHKRPKDYRRQYKWD